MKKVFLTAIALFASLSLCACAAPAQKGAQTGATPTDGLQPSPEMTAAAPELSAKYMKEPPALTVSFGDSSVTVNPFGYEWTETLPDGTAATAVACGAHPLDAASRHKTLFIANDTEKDVSVNLSFDAAPESVSLSLWSESDVGNLSAAPEKREISGTAFAMPQGVFIIEADASFGEKGSAHYAFRVDRTPALCGLPPAPGVVPPYVPPDTASR